jgi:choline dehydrogenase-like flavoprotein
MDHLLLRPGLDISLTHPGIDLRLYHALHNVEGGRKFAIVAATESLLRKEQLTNFRAHLYPITPRYRRPIGGIFSDVDGFSNANPLEKSRDNSIAIHMVLEPVPNPESRITLSRTSFDMFEQPKLEVRWLVEDADLEHAYRAMVLIAIEFGRMGLGRGYSQLFKDKTRWPGHMEAGKHHCGTTRMSNDPRTGVIDENCKVFGMDNLYIAGSSVFPTIGYANPTFTIVALALRLSDHIKRQLT